MVEYGVKYSKQWRILCERLSKSNLSMNGVLSNTSSILLSSKEIRHHKTLPF
jgi:hypothetical protein